jgi:hypothetical protein
MWKIKKGRRRVEEHVELFDATRRLSEEEDE